ncbi:hypothetical protein AN459_17740 [Pseudomonas aeruginosa]|nr:hypothetical protein AN459_17740 [Pseudomonas aeruginosa]KSR22245.1 hypothetical protein APB43_12500 [Pseudomonas aeruginosa]RMK39844.1 hypothetical protein IPC92_26485 [Pseudomonas aeruginosa]
MDGLIWLLIPLELAPGGEGLVSEPHLLSDDLAIGVAVRGHLDGLLFELTDEVAELLAGLLCDLAFA